MHNSLITLNRTEVEKNKCAWKAQSGRENLKRN